MHFMLDFGEKIKLKKTKIEVQNVQLTKKGREWRWSRGG